MKKAYNFLDSIGIISLLSLVTKLIKQFNELTSTKLYDQKALEDLKEEDKFEKVYGRPRTHESTII